MKQYKPVEMTVLAVDEKDILTSSVLWSNGQYDEGADIILWGQPTFE